MNGTLLLDEMDISGYTFIIDGWAVYSGVLLTPDDLINNTRTPDEYVFIGQHGGFEKLIGSPHGSVTYRMVIGIPDEWNSYMLALPEIFSSCRVYVNGREMLSLGEIDPNSYRFETSNEVITFDATGKIDLLIAVSDYRHLYSGMVYPPAIGLSSVVSNMLNIRFALHLASCIAALIIGITSLAVGLISRHKGVAVLYGILCLLFVGYTSYPVTLSLIHGSPALYALENVSFCAMLLVVSYLQNKLSYNVSRLKKIFPFILGLGIFTCLTALIMPIILPHISLSMMMAYSKLITAYQWITAGYITFTTGLSVWKKESDAVSLFYGMLVFDCTLVMDRILHSYEPIYSGWFPEIGSLILVLSIGAVTIHEIAYQYRENTVQEERVRVIISTGREHYQEMNNMYDTLRILRHDYKYHLNAMRGLLKSGNQSDIDNYLTSVEALIINNELQIFCQNSVINALFSSYAKRCEMLNIEYDIIVSLPDKISIPDYEMNIILGNLLENAVEACQKKKGDKRIELNIKPQGTQLAIMVRNSFNGKIIKERGQLISDKRNGGLGLRSIQSVIARHGGELITEWDEQSFTTYILMNYQTRSKQ